MANEQSNTALDYDATHVVDGAATLSVTPPDAEFEKQSISDKSADSASSSVQPRPSQLLWHTPEGRIAAYKRMIRTKYLPEQRANLEALIRYYEDGGKVPEGQEELWAFDGQTSFGIRKYTSSNPPPEGWLYKIKFCDVSGFCLGRCWLQAGRPLISFALFHC